MDSLERYQGPILVLLLALVLAGSVVLVLRRPEPQPLEVPIPTRSPTARPGPIKVFVNGAVVRPDVYTLQPGDRVKDAIEAAGGVSPDADESRVPNLAARLSDGQQVYVPRRGETAGFSAPGVSGPPALININTASGVELDSLPGIGPTTSQRIIEHRNKNGPFQRIEELKEKKLVNSSTFERIKELITVQ